MNNHQSINHRSRTYYVLQNMIGVRVRYKGRNEAIITLKEFMFYVLSRKITYTYI